MLLLPCIWPIVLLIFVCKSEQSRRSHLFFFHFFPLLLLLPLLPPLDLKLLPLILPGSDHSGQVNALSSYALLHLIEEIALDQSRTALFLLTELVHVQLYLVTAHLGHFLAQLADQVLGGFVAAVQDFQELQALSVRDFLLVGFYDQRQRLELVHQADHAVCFSGESGVRPVPLVAALEVLHQGFLLRLGFALAREFLTGEVTIRNN